LQDLKGRERDLQNMAEFSDLEQAGFLHDRVLMRNWIDELEDRTKAFAVQIIKLAERLESTRLPRTVIWQLVDAGTSVAANHRACRRARSTKRLEESRVART